MKTPNVCLLTLFLVAGVSLMIEYPGGLWGYVGAGLLGLFCAALSGELDEVKKQP